MFAIYFQMVQMRSVCVGGGGRGREGEEERTSQGKRGREGEGERNLGGSCQIFSGLKFCK